MTDADEVVSDRPAAVARTAAPTPVVLRDVPRTVLGVLLIGVLIVASFWVLRPFLLSLIWAAMIAVATWPLMLKMEARLRRRWLAVA